MAGVETILAHDANSTMSTECCSVAICDDEEKCPKCKINVIGYDAGSDGERGNIRWRYATRLWKR